jgi:hypothetical protein
MNLINRVHHSREKREYIAEINIRNEKKFRRPNPQRPDLRWLPLIATAVKSKFIDHKYEKNLIFGLVKTLVNLSMMFSLFDYCDCCCVSE